MLHDECHPVQRKLACKLLSTLWLIPIFSLQSTIHKRENDHKIVSSKLKNSMADGNGQNPTLGYFIALAKAEALSKLLIYPI